VTPSWIASLLKRNAELEAAAKAKPSAPSDHGRAIKAMLAIGALTVSLANAPAVVELARKPAPPPPAATKADAELTIREVRALNDRLDTLTVYLCQKHLADVAWHRKHEAAIKQLAGKNEVLTSPTPYPLPPTPPIRTGASEPCG
jgi:hypothetical protein